MYIDNKPSAIKIFLHFFILFSPSAATYMWLLFCVNMIFEWPGNVMYIFIFGVF